MKHAKLYSDILQALKGKSFDSFGFSAEGTLISADGTSPCEKESLYIYADEGSPKPKRKKIKQRFKIDAHIHHKRALNLFSSPAGFYDCTRWHPMVTLLSWWMGGDRATVACNLRAVSRTDW